MRLKINEKLECRSLSLSVKSVSSDAEVRLDVLKITARYFTKDRQLVTKSSTQCRDVEKVTRAPSKNRLHFR